MTLLVTPAQSFDRPKPRRCRTGDALPLGGFDPQFVPAMLLRGTSGPPGGHSATEDSPRDAFCVKLRVIKRAGLITGASGQRRAGFFSAAEPPRWSRFQLADQQKQGGPTMAGKAKPRFLVRRRDGEIEFFVRDSRGKERPATAEELEAGRLQKAAWFGRMAKAVRTLRQAILYDPNWEPPDTARLDEMFRRKTLGEPLSRTEMAILGWIERRNAFPPTAPDNPTSDTEGFVPFSILYPKEFSSYNAAKRFLHKTPGIQHYKPHKNGCEPLYAAFLREISLVCSALRVGVAG